MRGRHAVRWLAAAAVVAGVACTSIVGWESEYVVVPPDAGTPGAGGDGAGGSGNGPTTGGAGTGGAGGAGGGACEHSPCVLGGPLDETCPCAETVCNVLPECCTDIWHIGCTEGAQLGCGMMCCGDGNCVGAGSNTCTSCPEDCGDCTCPHSVCEVGEALTQDSCREACTDPVCGQMPDCCPKFFAPKECIELAKSVCQPDPCIAAVCAQDSGCCSNGWDSGCVELAKTECTLQCDCAHPMCQMGAGLAQDCNPCVTAICGKIDPYCCTNMWDHFCVALVGNVCDIQC